MSEVSRDTTEDGFHEIQLSGKQLVFLFIVTTSVVVGVFLFGVLVGRGAREPRANDAVSSASAPPEASPMADSAPPAGDPPPVALEEDAQPVPPSISEGSAPPPATPAAPPEPAPNAPAPAPVPSQKDRASDVPESGTPGIWLVQVIATREQADAASLAKRLEAKGYPAFLVSPSPGARQPFYKVQVGRYKDRSEAEQVSQRIKKEEKFQSWILR
ncbi:MAG: SPOR domain-containing protein [Acidobacteriota bacterium]|nr:SPOR domain-containing protein [Acidobacteriota bacterium]